jgi:hypothetical protein
MPSGVIRSTLRKIKPSLSRFYLYRSLRAAGVLALGGSYSFLLTVYEIRCRRMASTLDSMARTPPNLNEVNKATIKMQSKSASLS